METIRSFFQRLRGRRREVEVRVEDQEPPKRWRYFNDKEVESLDPAFVDILDRARHISQTPYIITSGFRSEDQNSGGVEDSAHLTGKAVDLRAHDSLTRFKILKGLFAVGVVRIGIYSAHVHCDIDPAKPQGVIWLGGKSK